MKSPQETTRVLHSLTLILLVAASITPAARSTTASESEVEKREYIEALVRMVERDSDPARLNFPAIYKALSEHDPKWIEDRRLVARLRTPLSRAYPILQQTDPSKIEDWRDWYVVTELIAHVPDPEWIPWLRLFLSEKAQVNDSVGPEYDYRRIAPFRACDQAHNMILTMLRRQSEMILVQRDLAMSKPEQLAARDAKVDKLRKELDSTKQ